MYTRTFSPFHARHWHAMEWSTHWRDLTESMSETTPVLWVSGGFGVSVGLDAEFATGLDLAGGFEVGVAVSGVWGLG